MPRTQDQPTCPLCSKPGALIHEKVTDRAMGVAGEWSFRDCDGCKVVWLDPQPIDEDIGLCYPTTYYTHEADHAEEPSMFAGSGLKAKLRNAVLAGRYGYEVPGVGGAEKAVGKLLGGLASVRYRVAYVTDHSLPVWRKGGRLLDVGSGAGNYLRFAKRLGWQTFGLDPDPAAAAVAARTGATMTVGTLDTATLADAPFDAVVSMHSIEHARNPREFLAKALALLRPGGFFYLQTPNAGSLMHRRHGADWFALETPRHLCLQTVPGLRRLVGEAARWDTLTVRSNPRRARREQEHTLAMRHTGNFEQPTTYSAGERVSMSAWALVERLGNRAMEWGEEIEVFGIKAGGAE